MGVIEAMVRQKNGGTVFPNYSEQQIIDCSGGYGNMGCSGGLMTNSFNYLKSYKLQTETSYPYTATKGSCRYNANSGVLNTKGFVGVKANSPAAHMNAVAQFPISVAVQSTSSAFQFYKSGIITSTGCGTSLDHAVIMVGYGTENGVDYWRVRNSWGGNWGESGFFRVKRDNVNGPGICGVLKLSSYPLI